MIKVKLKTVNEQLDESLDEQGIMSKIASLNPFRQNKQISKNLDTLFARIQKSQELLKQINYDASKEKARETIAKAKDIQTKAKLETQLKQYNEKLAATYKQINDEIVKLQNLFNANNLNQETATQTISKVTELVSVIKSTANNIPDEDKKKKMLAGLAAIENYPVIIQRLSANAGTFNKINDVNKFKASLKNSIISSQYYSLNEQTNLKPFLDYCFSRFITDKKLLTAAALSKQLSSLKTLSEAKPKASKFKDTPVAQQEPEQTTQTYEIIKKNLIKSIKSLKIPDILKALINNSIISKVGEDSDDLLLKYALFFSTYKNYLAKHNIQYSSDLEAIGSLSEQLLKAFGTK